MDGTLERHGHIDLLVNNAGGQFLTPAEDITAKGFRTVMRLKRRGHLADEPHGGHPGDDGRGG